MRRTQRVLRVVGLVLFVCIVAATYLVMAVAQINEWQAEAQSDD